MAQSRRAIGNDRRGSMLIVALGILTLLSVLALTFVSIMRLEQVASTNYVDGVKARLIAEGGLETAGTQLKVYALGESYSDPGAPHIYARGDYSLPIEEATVLGEPGDAPDRRASFGATVASSYNQGIDRYKVKVIDTQTQFNLNSRYEVVGDVDRCYVRFLDALGVAISRLNTRARTGTVAAGGAGRNPIATARYPKGSPNAWRGGEAIYRFRQSREGQRFNSKSELMEVLFHEDDFNLLQDYVSTRSWFDPTTVTAVPMDGLDNKPWSDVQVKELRSPINLNLASEEVIAANLAGIAGRFIYLYTGDYDARNARIQSIDQGTNFAFDAKKEEIAYGTVGVLVYISPFGFLQGPQATDPPVIEGALEFARLIKLHIKQQGPFKTFAEWEDFVDTTLTDSFLETKSVNGVQCFPGHNRGPLDPLMLQLDEKALTTPSVAEVRRQKDFPARFYEAVRSMIKANFNPNPRLSGWNPDHVVHLPCDKGSLLYPADVNAPASTKAQRQTNEWCLASKGVFEITSLGEVLGNVPELAAGAPPPAGPPKRIIYAQAKVQGVVQLYETLTHTSQRDFERNGGKFKALDDREMVESYPVPRLYWDPRAEQLADSFLDDATGRFLHADDAHGYLQLKTRMQEGQVPDQIDSLAPGGDTGVIDMGKRRFELLVQERHMESPTSTQASNDDNLIAAGAAGQRIARNMGKGPSDGRPPTAFAWPFGTAPQGVAPATRSATEQLAWRWDVLAPDGYLNSELRRTLLWYRASDRNSLAMPADPDGRLRGDSMAMADGTNTYGNVVPTHKGGFELWYKPDFDWNVGTDATPIADQRYCGLLATSHVTQNADGYQGGQSNEKNSWTRGTQMYVTRNTSGELRITRLYYEVVGPSGHPQEEPRLMDPKGTALISFTEYLNRATSDPEYVWPPVELLWIPQPYHGIKFSRTDHWVPFNSSPHGPNKTLAKWKAHEWHHIAAYWNDATGDVWVWLDGLPYTPASGLVVRQWQNAPGSNPPRAANARYKPYVKNPQGPNPGPAVVPADSVTFPPQGLPGPSENPSFVRLNALTGPTAPPAGVSQPAYEDSLWPKDQLMIGAVRRDQAVVGGLFKHDKDALLPANGTLDDVRFYEAGTPPNANTTGVATRFDAGDEVGVWTNEFDLSRAFQNGATEIQLAGIHYTAYLPRRYAGEQVSTNGSGKVSVEFEVRRQDGSVVKPNHWKRDRANPVGNVFSMIRGNPQNNDTCLAEIKLTDDNGLPVRVTRTDRLVYKVYFSAATTPSGVAFASPVLDDISLVYYLPNPQVLLKERVIN